MKIEKHTFKGRNPHANRELIAEGPLGSMDQMLDGSGEHKIFLHSGPHSDGYWITFAQAEWAGVLKWAIASRK